MLAVLPTLAALTWDPQIRGASIVIIATAILCGSVYLLLATNTGAKLGLLLAVAGLSGWMVLMGIVWTTFGIGLKGRQAEWVVQEVIEGPAEAGTVGALESFPQGWEERSAAAASDAQAAADQVLARAAESAGDHGAEGGGGGDHAEFEPLFGEADDYVQVAAYETGGEDHFLPGGGWEHDRGIFHKPHYMVVQVKPVLEVEVPDGAAPPPPEPDPNAEVVTVVLVRDLGSLRLPPAILTLSMLVVFGVSCNALHRRDKEIMRLRAATA